MAFDGLRDMLTSLRLKSDLDETAFWMPLPAAWTDAMLVAAEADTVLVGLGLLNPAARSSTPDGPCDTSLAIVGLIAFLSLAASSFLAFTTARRSSDFRFGVLVGFVPVREALRAERKGVGMMDEERSEERNDVGNSLGRSEGVSEGRASA